MINLPQSIIHETALLERFLRYVQIDTQANPNSETFPSSPKEKDLSKILAQELREIGISNAEMDEYGYVYAKLPSNCGSARRIAFLAHVDVAPDVKGEGVKPVVHKNFNGEKALYPTGDELIASKNHGLRDAKGQTLITSDGTTLLGADDKAGVAAIMTCAEYLLKHPEIKRPEICICFTPDEEIGSGVNHISIEKLNSEFGYTVDGHLPGEYNFENFYAWSASANIRGRNHHPGDARGNMISAVRLAAQLVARIPQHMLPETTSEYEPFIHAHTATGNTEEATIQFILRAFSEDHIELEKNILKEICLSLETEYSGAKVALSFKEQYKNMRPMAEAQPQCLQALKNAMTKIGLTPKAVPIRGGTDGARLSYMGLPCPNIFTGGSNFHSTREWVTLENMAQASATLVALTQEFVDLK